MPRFTTIGVTDSSESRVRRIGNCVPLALSTATDRTATIGERVIHPAYDDRPAAQWPVFRAGSLQPWGTAFLRAIRSVLDKFRGSIFGHRVA